MKPRRRRPPNNRSSSSSARSVKKSSPQSSGPTSSSGSSSSSQHQTLFEASLLEPPSAVAAPSNHYYYHRYHPATTSTTTSQQRGNPASSTVAKKKNPNNNNMSVAINIKRNLSDKDLEHENGGSFSDMLPQKREQYDKFPTAKTNFKTADNSPLSRLPAEVYFITWLFLNIALTLLNKAVFSFGDFNFPLTLSAIHMLITGILSWICVHQLKWFPYNPHIDTKGQYILLFFSFIFSINIVMGNVSIQIVSVSLVQVFRAIIPGVTMLLAYLILGKRSSFLLILSMIPICFGVMLTVSGELDLGFLGLFYTILGTFLSALKVVVCNKFLDGHYEMNPLDLLARVAPLAFVQTMVMVYFLEWEGLSQNLHYFADFNVMFSVIGSGLMAWLLNVTNFFTNQKTSPVTLAVGGNVKQILTIVLSIIIFKNIVTPLSALGMLVTILGAMGYSVVNYKKL